MKYLIGIIVLGLVVLFHEFGHFLLARMNHIVVEEFSLGMGPRILSHTSRKSGTVYSWKLLPFGGSCAMLNEEEGEPTEGSFIGAKIWQRALVVAAGPAFNLILAFLISVILVSVTGADPAYLAGIESGTPEAEAGLQDGDRVVRYNGSTIANSRELYMVSLMNETPTDEITMTVVHADGQKEKISYQPELTSRYLLGFSYGESDNGDGILVSMVNKDSVLKGSGIQMGDVITSINGVPISGMESMGNYLSEHPMDGSPVTLTYKSANGKEKEVAGLIPVEKKLAVLHFGFQAARVKQGIGGIIAYSFGEVGLWVRVTGRTLAGMFSGLFSVNDMSGPVGIVKSMGDTVADTAKEYSVLSAVLTMLSLASMISCNLGLMNLIPLPALDGGRLLMMLIEAVSRKEVNRNVEAFINYAGLIALMVLMAFVTAYDILKLF
ncbi:MAG: RIP metalloprotease RseP [Eubacteriales bacterium]|nr:RIP metalloprotease RseP [Eubacteriales bacterium]